MKNSQNHFARHSLLRLIAQLALIGISFHWVFAKAMQPSKLTPRILSIQSHTVHGFVGNKAVAFPLQTMGFDIDCINTVSISNHPAYSKGCKGQLLPPDVLSQICEGLEENDLLNYDIIMTGYTRSMEHLESIESMVKKIQAKNPHTLYICDPVLGDNEQYYVPSELMTKYKQTLLPLANVITPNIFESQVLSGITIKTTEDAIQACKKLHALGPEICILTGVPITSNTIPSLAQSTPTTSATSSPNPTTSIPRQLSTILSIKPKRFFRKHQVFAASEEEDIEEESLIFRVDAPSVEGYFAGCGDLFSAFTAGGLYHFVKSLLGLNTATAALHHVYKLGALLEIFVTSMSKVVEITNAYQDRTLSIIESREVFVEAIRKIRLLFPLPLPLPAVTTTITALPAATVETSSSPSGSPVSTTTTSTTTGSTTTTASTATMTSAASASYLIQHPHILGVIFDLDGTLTHDGAIDFTAMYSRTGLKHHPDQDLFTLIQQLPTLEAQQDALQIIYEEEMKGCAKQVLRDQVYDFLAYLQTQKKLRLAICTRNCHEAVEYFMNQLTTNNTNGITNGISNGNSDGIGGIVTDMMSTLEVTSSSSNMNKQVKASNSKLIFHPILARNTLPGITKPNPLLAKHILSTWEILPGQERAIWFLGDSLDDMKCGKLAGCSTCLIVTEMNNELSTLYPEYIDATVTNLHDFLKIVHLE